MKTIQVNIVRNKPIDESFIAKIKDVFETTICPTTGLRTLEEFDSYEGDTITFGLKDQPDGTAIAVYSKTIEVTDRSDETRE